MIGESGSPRRQVRSPRVSAAAGQVVRAARQTDPGEEAEEEQITSPADLCSSFLRGIADHALLVRFHLPQRRQGRLRVRADGRGQCRLAAHWPFAVRKRAVVGPGTAGFAAGPADAGLETAFCRTSDELFNRSISSGTASAAPPRLNANAPRAAPAVRIRQHRLRSATLVSSSRNAVPVPEPQPAASTASNKTPASPFPD